MKKTLLIASIATAVGLSTSSASAALYVHQDAPVVNAEMAKKDAFVVVHDGTVESYDQKQAGKESSPVIAKKKASGKEPSQKHFKGKETPKEVQVASHKPTKPINSSHVVDSPIEIHSAKMEKGFLSNGMRKHLEKMGWDLQWSSGSDRQISIPYTIEYKNPVDYVTQISGLYGITVDVYPKNKTVHVQD